MGYEKIKAFLSWAELNLLPSVSDKGSVKHKTKQKRLSPGQEESHLRSAKAQSVDLRFFSVANLPY